MREILAAALSAEPPVRLSDLQSVVLEELQKAHKVGEATPVRVVVGPLEQVNHQFIGPRLEMVDRYAADVKRQFPGRVLATSYLGDVHRFPGVTTWDIQALLLGILGSGHIRSVHLAPGWEECPHAASAYGIADDLVIPVYLGATDIHQPNIVFNSSD